LALVEKPECDAIRQHFDWRRMKYHATTGRLIRWVNTPTTESSPRAALATRCSKLWRAHKHETERMEKETIKKSAKD